MQDCDGVGHHDESIDFVIECFLKSAREVRRRVELERHDVHAEPSRDTLHGLELDLGFGDASVPQKSHPSNTWCYLLQHLKPLRAKRLDSHAQAGDIATRTVEGAGLASSYQIASHGKHDRDLCSCCRDDRCGSGIADYDYIWTGGDDLGHDVRVALNLTVDAVGVNEDVSAICPSVLCQAVPEDVDERHAGRWKPWPDIRDPRQ